MPDETRRALKARAAACGDSLNAYLLELTNREVARPTVGEVLERAERAAVPAANIINAARTERS